MGATLQTSAETGVLEMKDSNERVEMREDMRNMRQKVSKSHVDLKSGMGGRCGGQQPDTARFLFVKMTFMLECCRHNIREREMKLVVRNNEEMVEGLAPDRTDGRGTAPRFDRVGESTFSKFNPLRFSSRSKAIFSIACFSLVSG